MADKTQASAPRLAVEDLIPGEHVDLEGDRYADPNGDTIAYQSEYAVVDSVEIETPKCTVVHFINGPSIGFPTGWTLKKDPTQIAAWREKVLKHMADDDDGSAQ